jgi:uncharacterized protein (DUF362 family)
MSERTRRDFLGLGVRAAAAVPLVLAPRAGKASADLPPPAPLGPGERAANLAAAKVSIVACRGYGPEMREALIKSFDLLGGIGGLVSGKTVTVKVNLTGRPFQEVDGRSPTETYITHDATAIALAGTLLDGGARRVRFVESAPFAQPLEAVLGMAGWDVKALLALKGVEVENTRNLGLGTRYATMKAPSGGHMFSSFELNRAYEETDVFVSLAKLKNHALAGVTLSMKNLFGITPNSLYGGWKASEDVIGGRTLLHAPWRSLSRSFPGQREGDVSPRPGHRVPRIIVDLCAARPVHLAILDGITSVAGAEGPWVDGLRPVSPGVLVCGLNPVSTDAVATAVMGYPDPRAAFGTLPFVSGDNHVALADQMGLGTADLGKIDLRGMKIAEAVHPFGAVGSYETGSSGAQS